MYIENIADGVRLCVHSTDKFKTCRINISMAMPLDSNASARAVLPFLLHRRCAKYPDFTALNRALDELYGASVSCGVLKRGEAQVIFFTLSAIDDRFALDGEKIALKCIELLTDMIFDPLITDGTFPADIVDREKYLLKEAIENEKNNKVRYALLQCESVMFKDEKYGINPLGTVEDVEALTPDDIYYAWQEELREANIQITAVGSMEVEPLVQMLKNRFESIKRLPAVLQTQFITAAPKPDYVCEEAAVKQGKLVMGFRTGMRNEDDNAAATRVAVDIFGGGTYSRLFSVVREKMSLCYYCSASLANTKGVVMVQSGIENANEEKAKSEIMNQLSLIANGDFDGELLSSSVKSITDSVISSNDTPETVCAWYSAQLTREKLKTPEEYCEEIRAVDKQQVIRAAKSIMLDTVFMLKSNGEENGDEN